MLFKWFIWLSWGIRNIIHIGYIRFGYIGKIRYIGYYSGIGYNGYVSYFYIGLVI